MRLSDMQLIRKGCKEKWPSPPDKLLGIEAELVALVGVSDPDKRYQQRVRETLQSIRGRLAELQPGEVAHV